MTESSSKDEVIVCRCRDVTERDIRSAIREGYDTIELLKRKTKIATGTCGGRTCLPIVAGILAEETGKEIRKLELPRGRAPIIPVPMRYLVGEEVNDG